MKKLWFKRKSYGWGWTPNTWQGWVVTIVYCAILIALASFVSWNNTREMIVRFFLPLVIVTLVFIRIAYVTGEEPRWQWGSKPSK